MIKRIFGLMRKQGRILPAASITSGEAGYTLVELLVVLVILVLLATFVTPRVIGYLSSSRTKAARIQIQSLSTVVEAFATDVGRYPTTDEGLDALVKRPAALSQWHGPYINADTVPLDPWDRPYFYRSPGKKKSFDIYSLGQDGKEGGDGEDADVSN